MRATDFAVVVAWHNLDQLTKFKRAWSLLGAAPDWLILQRDEDRSGCARTKNAGIQRAIERGFKGVVVLDDDCFPADGIGLLDTLRHAHFHALAPVDVEMFQTVTSPVSRGTPYHTRTMRMPVAASMGFWRNVGDYDAPAQLVHGATHPMEFRKDPIFGRYFALSGMNVAFSLEWWPWCRFIDVPRFDDIWMGWLFQKHAYAKGYCFNPAGPEVMHSRQSNVWANLRDEAKWLEVNETLWRSIAQSPETDYARLCELLPPEVRP